LCWTCLRRQKNPDFRVVAQGIDIGVCRAKTDETSSEAYVSLPTAASECGPKKLDANIARAAGVDDENLCAAIWNPGD
jgi:uncharacterized protein (DUF736 family)